MLNKAAPETGSRPELCLRELIQRYRVSNSARKD